MNTFEVDVVATVEAEDDEAAEGLILETLKEQERVKEVEVLHIMDTQTYGK